MTKLQPYAEYKDTGVAWLGRIPSHWEVVPLKRRATTGAGAGFPHEFQGVPNGEIPFYKVNSLAKASKDGVIDFVDEAVSRDTALSLRAKIYPAGSAVLAKIGAALLLGRIRTLGIDACIDNNMMSVQADNRTDSRFLYYALTLIRFDLLVNPGAVPSTSEGAVAEWMLAFPGREEQQRIAAFLDSETAQIDELIGKQERLIGLLEEKRQAIITHAVTKGLDPAAPTKPSGVPWQGPVPEDWTVQPLKNLIRMQTGVTLGKDFSEVETETYPYLRVANVQIGYVDLNEVKEIDLPKDVATTSMLQAGDVLMTEGGDRDKLARGCIWEAPIAPCVHQNHIFAVRTGNQLFNQFLVLALDADPARAYFYLTGKQSTNLASTNSTTVKNFRFGVPPMVEQHRIVDHLRRKTRLIDDLMDKANAVISTLKERRSALISAAVTGKIDVREGVA